MGEGALRKDGVCPLGIHFSLLQHRLRKGWVRDQEEGHLVLDARRRRRLEAGCGDATGNCQSAIPEVEGRKPGDPPEDDTPPDEQGAKPPSYDDIEQRAIEGLQQYINAKNAYEFQDLVAALLRGMGYYTPFVAPKGKDGGVDVIAYRDPLGTQSPRIQVQIKHKEAGASVQEVRQLMGLLQKEGDVGMFVSTSGFSPDARAAARGSHIHVELVDLNRFISLWQEFYDKLKDEDKNLLPLHPIYFLAPVE